MPSDQGFCRKRIEGGGFPPAIAVLLTRGNAAEVDGGIWVAQPPSTDIAIAEHQARCIKVGAALREGGERADGDAPTA